MNSHQIFGLVQVIVVIALVVIAAALATPKGRVPLALRGLLKIVRRDAGASGSEGPSGTGGTVPRWKRLLAFVLVVLAFMLAMIVV